MQDIGFDTRYFGIFLIGLLSVISVYYVANVSAEIKDESYLRKVVKFVLLFPVFLALSMGLSLHNTIAVLQGWWGKESPFVRTPKFNINGIKDTFRKQKYFQSNISWTTIFEGLLAVYFLFAVIAGWQMEENAFLAYHILLMMGFGAIFYYSIRHLNLR